MLASIRYTRGLGSSAVYARVRNAAGAFLVFATGAWRDTEDATCQTFLPEVSDSSTESRYQAEIAAPWLTVDAILEYVLLASGDVLGEDTLWAQGSPMAPGASPAPGDLTTLAAVKAELFPNDPSVIAFDDRLSALISAVSARFESEVGRVLGSASYTRTFDGNGRSRLLLPEYPVSAVASITVDGTPIDERATVTGSGWVISDGAVGELTLVGYDFTEGVQNVEVEYTAGFSPLPADIEQAVRETVVAKWKKDPNEQLAIDSAGGQYTQFRPPFVWPPFAYAVIQAYRRPSVG